MSDASAPGSRRVAARLAQVVFVAAVAVVIALYLARSWDAIGAYEWHLRPLPLLGAALSFALFYLLSGLLWWLILRACGLRSGRLRAVTTWGQSILARYLPGNVFMFVGRLWMSVRQGLEPDRVTAAMVYEQVLGVAGALLTAAVLFPFWEYRRSLTAWSLVAVPLLVALLHPRVFAPLAALLLRLLRRPPLRQVMSFRWVCLCLAWTVALWLLAGVGGWLTAVAVTDAGGDALPPITVALAVAFVAGMVAFFVPSGIGVREGVLAAAAAGVLPGAAVALAWALLLRLWLTLVELAFVAIVTLADRVARRRRDGSTTETLPDTAAEAPRDTAAEALPDTAADSASGDVTGSVTGAANGAATGDDPREGAA